MNRTKTANPKTFKVEFADRELNFLSDEIFEARNNTDALTKAKKITERRFGNILQVYSLVRLAGQWLWRAI